MILLALLASLSCGARHDAMPRIQRLLDLWLEGAPGCRLESSVDLGVDSGAWRIDADSVAAPRDLLSGAVVQQDLARELLGAEGRLAVLTTRLASRTGGRLRVQVVPPVTAAFAVAVAKSLDESSLRDADTLREVARYLRPVWVPLERGTNGMRVDLDVGPDGETLLLFAAVARGEEDARCRVDRLGPIGVALAASRPDPRSGHVRGVTVERVTRPSLVVGVPGFFECRVRVPRGGARLIGSVAGFARSGGGELAVGVQGAAAATVTWPRRPGWRDFAVDLASFSGREVDLRFSFSGSPGSMAALGAPRIVPLARDPRPDVVIVSLDTLRLDHTALGPDPRRSATPALDAFLADAVAYETAVAAAPWTLPSHVSFFSGQHVDRHGVHEEHARVPAGLPWLPEDFARSGYETYAFTGGGFVSPQFGFDRGFDRFETVDPAYPDESWARARGREDEIRRAGESRAARERLLALLAETSRGPPRLVFVHTYAAHQYAVPPEVLASLGASEETLRRDLGGFDPVRTMNALRRDPARANDPDLRERAVRLYRGAVGQADALFGAVLAALERSGRGASSVVVVFSDHGEELFDHGAVGHAHSVHEELIRVPLALRLPGTPAARVADVVSLVDVAPTLRARLGLLAPEGGFGPLQDGRELPGLGGRDARLDVAALVHGSRPGSDGMRVFRALRGERYKLVEDEREPRPHLYDVLEDPEERRDLAQSNPELLRRMRNALERLVERLRSLRGAGERAHLTERARRELEGLGYLGGGRKR